jgi:hypothetical protein
MKESYQTNEFIVEGFWMQGEFVCFLTYDSVNHLYLEMYGFETESIYSLGDKFEIGDISSYESLKLTISDNREFIAVIFYNSVSKFYDLTFKGPDQRLRSTNQWRGHRF